MPKYTVTVTFDRINPKTKKLEKNTFREASFWSSSKVEAKEAYLEMFKKNEPTRRKIHKVVVREVEE